MNCHDAYNLLEKGSAKKKKITHACVLIIDELRENHMGVRYISLPTFLKVLKFFKGKM